MAISPVLIPVVVWLVVLVIGVIAVLRVPPQQIPDVLDKLFPWRRWHQRRRRKLAGPLADPAGGSLEI